MSEVVINIMSYEYIFHRNDEQEFALVLFEDEDKHSVVETSTIQEKYYVINQTVHVLWGWGNQLHPSVQADFMW